MTPEDLYRLRWVEDPRLDPDGRRVAYVVRWAAEDRLGYRSAIRLIDENEDIALTPGLGRDWAPRWSPDGRFLAFLSDRAGGVQLWLMRPGGGEPVRLTQLPSSPGPAAWSPDGRRLCFTAAVADAPGQSPLPGYADDVRVIRRMHYKTNGVGMHADRHQQVFVSDLHGNCRAVTAGPYDHVQPAWSPDGRWLAMVARRDDDADLSPWLDIWCLDLGGARWVPATSGGLRCEQPSWSPDGCSIAFLGHDHRFARATNAKPWLVPSPLAASAGAPREILPAWDGEVGAHIMSDMRSSSPMPGILWDPDGRRIYFSADQRGQSAIMAADVAAGEVRVLDLGPRALFGLSLHVRSGRFVVAATDPANPGDLWTGQLGGGAPSRLTEANPWLGEVELSTPEPFACTTAEGLRVEGWAMPPVGRAAEPAPTVLQIHGGPHGAYGWAMFHEFQVLAARGFGVVYANPRGSTGYGQDFAALVQDHWGIGAYADLMAALDEAARRFPFVDPARLGVTGGSFGGYMTNWTVAHTDRFRAAVTQRSVANRYSFVGNNDSGYHSMDEYGAPWENPQHYLESSPLTYVDGIHTPLLILHSEQDLRCPIEQAEQLFTALKRLGRTVEFVRYPGENHELSRAGQPRHRVDRLWRIVRWFEAYLSPAAR